MSQPSTQTQPPVSGTVPSERTNSVTANNTAENAGINDPKSNTSSTGAGSDGGIRDVNAEVTPEQAQKEGLPEQKHAGAVGYGPEYASKSKATVGDKITGVKEQLIGKVTRKPELVQKGHERKTGELKRKEQGEDEADPFAKPEEQKDSTSTPASDAQGPGSATEKSTPNAGGTAGKSAEVDMAAGQSRLATDPSHPAAQDQGLQRAAAV